MNCDACLSLAKDIIVACDRGDHENSGYHEGNLGADWVRYRVRWNPIGSLDNGVQFLPRLTPQEGETP